MSKERNLLFGLLAVALGKLAPERLAAAPPSEEDLGRKLVEDGTLAEDDRDALDTLADVALKAHRGDIVAAVKTLGGSDPELRSVVATMAGIEPDFTQGLAPDPSATAEMVESIFGEADGRMAFGTMRDLAGKAVPPEEIVPAVREHPGRYEFLREFGAGGMGKILLVQDTHFGRDVALKTLLPDKVGVQTQPGAPTTQLLTVPIIARFLQEARITGQLEHPSIVPVYELGYRDDGSLYYTMKFVRGKTLQDAIVACKTFQERLLLLPHFLDLCHALSYAHDRGVIHRDLKPLNVMIGEFGETVVIDWGIAKVKGTADIHEREMAESVRSLRLSDAEATAKTIYGQTIGSPYFMPPEQAAGRTEEIDERSDVYSLGAVLYAMLTSQAPYSNLKVREFMDRVESFDPKPMREVEPMVPAELAAICARAMARDPKDRYGTAKELTDDVQTFLSGGLVSAYEYNFGELLKRFVRKHWKALATASVFILSAVAFGVYYNIRVTKERDYAQEQEREAQRQRGIAEEQRQEAVTARDVAETQRARAQRELYYANIALAQRSIEELRMAQARAQLAACPPNHRNWEWGHLQALCNGDRMTLREGGRFVAYGLGGKVLLCGRDSGTVSVVDAATGEVRRKLIEKAGFGYVLAASADGARAALKGDKALVVWDLATGSEQFRFDEETELKQQHFLAFAKDGSTLAALNNDGILRVWRLSGDREPIFTLKVRQRQGFGVWLSPDGGRLLVQRSDFGESGWVRTFEALALPDGASLGQDELRDPLTAHAAAFSPDGRYLALGTDSEIQVWDVDNWTRLHTLPGRIAHPDTLAFSPDGAYVAAGTADGAVGLWRVTGGKGTVLPTAHQDAVRALTFRGDGGLLATASFDRTVRLWSTPDLTPAGEMRGHDKSLFAVAFSPDGKTLASGSFDGTTKLWDATAEAQYAPVDRMVHHPNRGWLAGAQGADVYLWDARTGRRLMHFAAPGRVGALALSRDGGTLAALAREGSQQTAVIWQTDTGAEVRSTQVSGDVESLVLGPDGPLLWTGSRLMAISPGPGISAADYGKATAYALSPGGRYLAVAAAVEGNDDARRITVHDAETSVRVGKFEVETQLKAALAFSPDDAVLCVGTWPRGEGGRVHVFDTERGEVTQTLDGHGRQVECFAFSADGILLATGSTDSTVILRDRGTGEVRLELAGHASDVLALAFSPDATRLVTGSRDGTFKLWDTENGREILTVQNAAYGAEGQTAPDYAVFAADGGSLVTLTAPKVLSPRVLPALPWTGEHLDAEDEAELAEAIAGLKAAYWQ